MGKKSFEKVDSAAYAELLKDKGANEVTAVKSGNVLAREGKPGEVIQVWTKDGNLETTETVKAGQMIVTRAGEDGKPVIDGNGHDNSWVMAKDKFEKKYDVENRNADGTYKPAGSPQTFIEVDKDVEFSAPWGEVQRIRKGGYLNITNPKDVYGIAKDEFSETYKVVSAAYDKAVNKAADLRAKMPFTTLRAKMSFTTEQVMKGVDTINTSYDKFRSKVLEQHPEISAKDRLKSAMATFADANKEAEAVQSAYEME